MTNKSLPIKDAMTLSISESNQSVWTNYQLGALLFRLYNEKKYKDFKLNIRKNAPNYSDYNRIISELIQNNIIEYNNGKLFKVVARKNECDDAEIICAVDPYCYISHLSSMYYYKLTVENPNNIVVSSKNLKDWRATALSSMKKNLGELYENYRLSGLPTLTNINISDILDSKFTIYRSSDLGDYISIKYGKIRICSIGRTFLDMLRRPDLCGGIINVINVFTNNGRSYLNPIINEIDKFGSKIEKVRAGYIFEEFCGITDEIISGWQAFVMRGGSRKLDPLSDYSNKYSERWQISINI